MYRSGDDAARARAIAAIERRDAARDRLARTRSDERVLPSDDVARGEAALDEPGTDLASLAERIESEASALEREIGVAERAGRSSAPPVAAPQRARGAALARHLTLTRRLRAIAPLIHAVRSARRLPPVDPTTWLTRPPRGADDEATIRDIERQCAKVELRLVGLDLADATGHARDRARDVAKLRAALATQHARPELEALARALERYDAFVRALLEPRALAAGALARLGELPTITLDDEAAVRESAANVERATAELERLLTDMRVPRAAATPAPTAPPVVHESSGARLFGVARALVVANAALLFVLFTAAAVASGHLGAALAACVVSLRAMAFLRRPRPSEPARASSDEARREHTPLPDPASATQLQRRGESAPS